MPARSRPSALVRARAAVTAAALVASALALPMTERAPARAAASPARPILTKSDWLSVVNFYRATAGAKPVTAVDAWADGARLHSRYMVRNGILTHTERRGTRWYTRAGDAAGRNGNVSVNSSASESPREIVERWMRGPFHAAGIIDPRLTRSAFGRYRDPEARRWRSAATLDVIRGLRTDRRLGTVMWPADGAQVPIRTVTPGEHPDPLSPCRGYTTGAGLPLIVMLPERARLTATSFSSGGTALEHCSYDASTYRSSDAAEQRSAREILAARNMVVIVPRQPLRDLGAYTASVTAGRRTITWRFTVGEVTPPTRAAIVGLARRPFQERTAFAVGWDAHDGQSGIGGYDVRVREAPYGTGFGARRTWLTNHRERGATFGGTPGTTYCFVVRARDRAGNASGWSGESCTTLPLGALRLDRSPTWVPVAGDYYDTAALVNLAKGEVLRTRVRTRFVVLVASRCQGCGTVDVSLDGQRLARVDLNGTSQRTRQILEVARFSRARSGILTIEVSSAAEPVFIEGVGVGRA